MLQRILTLKGVVRVPIITFPQGVAFDNFDGEGVILDIRSGQYFSINRTATVMVDTCMKCATLDEAIEYLRQHINASEDTLRKGVQSLISQLGDANLLEG